MYIENLHYENVGPIRDLNITFRKNTSGVPVPVVVVGQNGSGKSILLSNIVDAFYELADKVYNNATQPREKSGHQYYKAITPAQIRIGQSHMLAHICFLQSDNKFEYVFKSGDLSFDEYSHRASTPITPTLNWKNASSHKAVSVDKAVVPSIFENGVVCFFGPNRYTKPSWMGSKYDVPDESMYSSNAKISDHLDNPITASNIAETTVQWLFDIITDSRADLVKKPGNKYEIVYPSTSTLDLLSISRANAESIMSQILGEQVIFRMRNRSSRNRRFSICKLDGTELVPSLDSLSTGQLALFNLFSTIIRYADNDDINLSHRLHEIKGIVVIDEIELHLHAQLQREILPKLISLFPGVQFIITSHSPLFLLGMREQFGEDNFDIIEMPSGAKISAEQFSEFENAYRYFTETNRYHREITDVINANNDKPLIITEGATDWKHMKAAYNALIDDSRCVEWLSSLNFKFLEYEPENSDAENCPKLKMSGSQLQTLCEQHSLISQPRKMIFIADCDVPVVKNKLGSNNRFKKWDNNVYSFCIPVPSHRSATPQICIEHLYQDEEIKREVSFTDGTVRRIFMGNEFDKEGFSINSDEFYCKNKDCCGPEKIDIIDGSDKKKVMKPWEKEKTANGEPKNYALSKMNFATYVLERKKPFEQMDFSCFIPIFEIIRDILAD